MTDKPIGDDIRHDDLTVERLRECFSYNVRTGVLRWKVSPSNNVKVGDAAGCLTKRGYLVVRLDGRLLLVHRVVWAMHYGVWPKGDLDHRRRDKSGNKIKNLRPASRPQNNANSPSRNRRGLPKGCYRLKGRQRWYSQIKVDGEIRRLGYFATANEAAVAFKRAHRAVHSDFSHCDVR